VTADRTRAEQLAESYLRARPRLVRVAYAVLGSLAEAEDVVADCWIRLSEANDRDPVLDVEAWTTVAVARRGARRIAVGPDPAGDLCRTVAARAAA